WHSTQNWGRTIVLHHDHLQPDGKPRFADVLICEDCNSVDRKLKTVLRRSLVKEGVRLSPDAATRRRVASSLNFSLSAAEIRGIISPSPHRRHVIHFDRAFV